MSDLPNEIKTLKADHRGRVNLGSEYAEEEVRVALLSPKVKWVDLNIYYEEAGEDPVEQLRLRPGEEHTAEVSGKQTIQVVDVEVVNGE